MDKVPTGGRCPKGMSRTERSPAQASAATAIAIGHFSLPLTTAVEQKRGLEPRVGAIQPFQDRHGRWHDDLPAARRCVPARKVPSPSCRKRPFAIHADRLQRSFWSAGCSAVAAQPRQAYDNLRAASDVDHCSPRARDPCTNAVLTARCSWEATTSASTRSSRRPPLDRLPTSAAGRDELMHLLQRGDRLVVSELSRLGRSRGQIVAILDALAKADVAWRSRSTFASRARATSRPRS